MRWPLQPLQPLQKTQLQPPFGPSVDSLCHSWFTTTNLSYRLPIFETSATALCGTTGIYINIYIYIPLYPFSPFLYPCISHTLLYPHILHRSKNLFFVAQALQSEPFHQGHIEPQNATSGEVNGTNFPRHPSNNHQSGRSCIAITQIYIYNDILVGSIWKWGIRPWLKTLKMAIWVRRSAKKMRVHYYLRYSQTNPYKSRNLM